MTDDTQMRLLYLGLFIAVIAGGVLWSNRHRLGQVLQQGAIWFFIFLGAALVAGNWERIEQTILPTQTFVSGEAGSEIIEVPRRRDGHYYMTLRINGERVDFVVDTGASDIVLSADDARAVGVDLRDLAYMGRAQTANGTIRTAQVFLDEVRIGEMVDRDVRAIVGDGDLGISLLGMSYLGAFGKIEIENNVLRLIR